MADPVRTNTDKVKQTLQNGAEAGQAIGGVVKDFFVGSKNKASGAVGGVAGFVKGIGNTAVSIATGTADVAFKTATTFKKTTTVALVIGAVIGIKKWMNNRDKSKDLEAARNANELMETKLSNDAVEAHMKSGKPVFDNDVAGNTAAKVAATRAAQAQMANAR